MSKELAIQKLRNELQALNHTSRPIQVMKRDVCSALVDFCEQDEEFAQAVLQGGGFSDCMTAVAKGVGQSISDVEAYRRAVQFYFPGADIRFQMSINLCASVEGQADSSPKSSKPKVLDLFDLM